ncbi:hypothetical protein BKA70DRAFT_1397951 [Coprinopsis sp. MPI-PUGE-AT-0042]|nr:hypothetical protein BKA70DRAFT_1397951 [Coprinopsis sp. MPI-PUGE-AT-0042]
MPNISKSTQVSVNDSHLSTAGANVNNIEVNITLNGQPPIEPTASLSLWSRIFGEWLWLPQACPLPFLIPYMMRVPEISAPEDGCTGAHPPALASANHCETILEDQIDGSIDVVPLDHADIYGRLALPTAPTRTPHEIYVRQLYPRGHGYPCANPMPWGKPVQIGDIGLLESDGFNVLQNLYTLLDDLLHEAPVPVVPTVYNPEIFVEGDTIAGGVNRCQVQMSNSTPMVLDEIVIHCPGDEGAVLVNTSPAELRQMKDSEAIRSYLCQIASKLFGFLLDHHHVPEGASVYVVTGAILSASWATATYDRPMDPSYDSLVLKRVAGHEGQSPYFVWTERGNAQTRTQGRQVRERKDQCLFLRGFLISASPAIWRTRREAVKLQSAHRERPKLQRNGHQVDKGSGAAQESSSCTGPGSSSSLPLPAPTTGMAVDSVPYRGTSSSDYPSYQINNALLGLTNADFAITHEDDWRDAITNADIPRSMAQDNNYTYALTARVREVMPRKVTTNNGVAFLTDHLSGGRSPTSSTLTATLAQPSHFGMVPLFRDREVGTEASEYSGYSDVDSLTGASVLTLVERPLARVLNRPMAKQLWATGDVDETRREESREKYDRADTVESEPVFFKSPIGKRRATSTRGKSPEIAETEESIRRRLLHVFILLSKYQICEYALSTRSLVIRLLVAPSSESTTQVPRWASSSREPDWVRALEQGRYQRRNIKGNITLEEKHWHPLLCERHHSSPFTGLVAPPPEFEGTSSLDMPIISESHHVNVADSHLSTAGANVNNIEVNVSLGGQPAREPASSQSLWSRILGEWLYGLSQASPLPIFALSGSSQGLGASVPENEQGHQRLPPLTDGQTSIVPLEHAHMYERLALPTVPTRQPHEIYVRQLYPTGNGYPCANPMPWGRPIQIGDIGKLESDGFRVLQNLYTLPDDFLQGNPVPIVPTVSEAEAFVDGDTITGGVDDSKVKMASSVIDEIVIHCPEEEGAALAITSPAELLRMESNDTLRDYLCNNASRLFDFLLESHSLPEGTSIYIVTGTVLSASWATATYNSRMNPSYNSLVLKRIAGDGSQPPYFMWTEKGNARTRTQGRQLRVTKDQCLFLKGFLLDASPEAEGYTPGKARSAERRKPRWHRLKHLTKGWQLHNSAGGRNHQLGVTSPFILARI